MDNVFIVAICYVTALYLIAWWINTRPPRHEAGERAVEVPRAIVVTR